MYRVILFLILILCWYIFSGYTEKFFVIGGICSCVLVLYFSELLKITKFSSASTLFPLRLLFYSFWLLKEISSSSFAILKIIWSHNMLITPVYGEISNKHENKIATTLYANSITLTPGTVTIKTGENFIVHALTNELFQSFEEGEMSARVSQVYKV